MDPELSTEAPPSQDLTGESGSEGPIPEPELGPPPDGMVPVQRGAFLFGEGRTSSKLPGFFIDRDPVTNASYERYVQATGAHPPLFWRNGTFPEGRDNHPVVGINLEEARAYAAWCGGRLPTEEEWEKAARGDDGRTYPWGDNFCEDHLNTKNTGVKDTTPVDRYGDGASPYGCRDMAGNVWEWTESWHDENRRFKVLRGGSWYDVAAFCKTTTRFSAKTDYRSACIGFRCVVGPELESSLLSLTPSAESDLVDPTDRSSSPESIRFLGSANPPELPDKEVFSQEDFLHDEQRREPAPEVDQGPIVPSQAVCGTSPVEPNPETKPELPPSGDPFPDQVQELLKSLGADPRTTASTPLPKPAPSNDQSTSIPETPEVPTVPPSPEDGEPLQTDLSESPERPARTTPRGIFDDEYTPELPPETQGIDLAGLEAPAYSTEPIPQPPDRLEGHVSEPVLGAQTIEPIEGTNPTPRRKETSEVPDLGQALGLFDEAEESLKRERLTELLEAARRYMTQNRLALAKNAWKQVLEFDPEHPEAKSQLSRIRSRRADRSQTQTGLSQARILAQRANALKRRSQGHLPKIAAAAIVVLVALLGIPILRSDTDDTAPSPARGTLDRPVTASSRDRAREATSRNQRSSPSRSSSRDGAAPDTSRPPSSERSNPSTSATGSYLPPPPGMVLIPKGTFLFGPNNVEIEVDAYYLDTHEVTNAEYELFVRDTGHPQPSHWIDGKPAPGTEKHPVTFVHYDDAQAYADWAEKRLPSELEWERAARGLEGRPYPWGSAFEPSRANMLQSVDDLVESGGLRNVGSYPRGKSEAGCADMIGNALEWTTDCLHPDDPRVRILKGGAWCMARDEGMAHARYGFFPSTTRNEFIGFRCAMDAYLAPRTVSSRSPNR